ncbi:MAG: hypothetical protein KDB82_06695 [Planctomycetes bacterium]|nr:hypothetical protein [Planctomycetota bacterium]
MSHFIVTFDYDMKKEVMDALREVAGVAVTGMPQRNGTITVKTVTRNLDAETAAVHAMEDIFGVLDVKFIEK